jgi:hypothetical protein
MEEGKEPALAAGEKQAGFNTILNLFRAFTLLMEEGKEPALAAGEKQAGSNTILNLFRAFTLLMEEGKEPALAAGEKQAGSNTRHNLDGTLNLYCGISACPKVSRQYEWIYHLYPRFDCNIAKLSALYANKRCTF